jgi:hypothetical protein
MSVGEFNRKTIEAFASCKATPICCCIHLAKLKVADPVATPIHLTYEYLTRSNNNHCKGTEIFVGNLLLHSIAQNVRLKLLADTSRYWIVPVFSIDPIVDRT